MTEGALEQLPGPSAAALAVLQTGDELAGAFLLSKRGPTRSPYRRDLANFATFLAATGVQPLAVRRAPVDAYARCSSATAPPRRPSRGAWPASQNQHSAREGAGLGTVPRH